jgi:glycosyl hydrolase family 26
MSSFGGIPAAQRHVASGDVKSNSAFRPVKGGGGAEDGLRVRRRGVLTVAALTAFMTACSRNAPSAAPPQRTLFTPMSTSPELPVPSPSATPIPSATPTKAPRKDEEEPEVKDVAKKTGKGGPVPALDRVMLGSYLALGGMSLSSSLALRRRQLGREQKIVHLFYGWSERMPSDVSIGKSTLMVSWHGTKLATVASGAQDSVIEAAAKKLAAYRKPMLLRWAWEMNGDWFEWGGDPGLFVQAYRRIHRIFRAGGADNVAFVWSPNWNSSPNTSANAISRYYPGDAYVDWVGVSGYNFYRESPSTLFRPVVSAYGKRKPIIVTETAAIDFGAGSKAAWIKKLSAYAGSTPSIGAVCWFDTDVQDDSKHNFRFDTSDDALAAYRAMARSARFSG